METLKWFIKEIFFSWQALGWAVLTLLVILIWTEKLNLNSLKAGSFEITFENKAKELGVFETPEFKNMKNLTEDELKLFLIIGGEEAQFYRFTNVALSNAASMNMYEKLQSDSLLRIMKLSKDSTMIYPTDIGEKVHRALIQSIYSQLIK